MQELIEKKNQKINEEKFLLNNNKDNNMNIEEESIQNKENKTINTTNDITNDDLKKIISNEEELLHKCNIDRISLNNIKNICKYFYFNLKKKDIKQYISKKYR